MIECELVKPCVPRLWFKVIAIAFIVGVMMAAPPFVQSSTGFFAGKTITALELHIDGFVLDSSPTPPPMPVNLQFTFSVFGVPEPGTAAMGLGALAMLGARRYSRRSKLGAAALR